jgi:RecA/RadA recombinase
VGLVGGRIVAIDFDLTNPAESEAAQQLATAIFGPTPLRRIGKAPKVVFLYRAEGEIRSHSLKGIDIIASGRQVAAFGIHPDTQQPYTWPQQSPLDIALEELPAITSAQVEEFLRRWAGVQDTGFVQQRPDDPAAYFAGTLTRRAELLRTMGEGGRNTCLSEGAYVCFRMVAAGAGTAEEVKQALTAAAIDAGLPPEEVQATLKSAEAGLRLPLWSEPPRRRGIQLLSCEEFLSLPPPSWLVDGMIPQGSLAVLFGAPAHGKSFVALEIAAGIATGQKVLATDARRGSVVYIAAEGQRGLQARLNSWQQHRGTTARDLHWVTTALDLCEVADPLGLIEAIRSKRFDPKLVVVDTVARNFGAGDENSTQDMNRFVRNVGSIAKAFPGATVLVVHHAGKQSQKGARGSSVLVAAADTVIRAEKVDLLVTLRCEKQKDDEAFKPVSFRLLKQGKSAVLVPAANDNREGPKLSDNQRKALDALAGPMAYGEWQQAAGIPRGSFGEVTKALQAKGLVKQEGGKYLRVDSLDAAL